MAEALGLASSIITVIELSAKAVKQCKHIIDTARDAPKDLRNILVEVSSLKAALENLDYLTKIDHDFAEEVSNQKGIGNAVNKCEETIGDLVKQLGDLTIRDSRQTQPGKRAKIKAAIAWTWNETTARKLINDVLQHKTTITLGLLTQTSREIHEVKLAVQDVQGTVSNDQRRKICDWIQTTNPTSIHNSALKNHETETSQWVLRLPQWESWLRGENSHRFLWIYGIPGAGKTVLSSYLVKQCQSYCNGSSDKPSICTYYYCSYRNHQDETLPMIRWLVSQLIRITRHMPNQLHADYEKDHQPGFYTMKDALCELLVHVQTVYLIVDAVDESQPRGELLIFLEELVTDPSFGRIQLLATSRKYHDITSVLMRLSSPISMSNEEVDKDIRRFLAARLEVKFTGWRAKYKTNILEVLVSKAQGMFRLAFCHVELISRKRTQAEMLDSLDSLPQTIEETYELILLEIDDQDWQSARTIFLWICGNDMIPYNEPIPISTLISVLNNNGSGSAISLPEDGKGYVEEICSCLITVGSSQFGSNLLSAELDAARCAHYTVVEFLFSEQIKHSKVKYFALSNDDIFTTFVGNTLAVAETVNSHAMCPPYWESFESYCARAAWLATFTWEPDLVESPALWTNLINIWSNNPSFFQDATNSYAHDEKKFPENNFAFYLSPEHNAESVQTFAPRILASLFLGSCHILANKLISHYGSQILELPFHFRLSFVKQYPQFGSAIEAAAIPTARNFTDYPILDCIEYLSEWFDSTRIALICVGLHAISGRDCGCYKSNNADDCRFTRMLRQYVKNGDGVQHRLTPLQFAVYCWDLDAVQALLESGADPNGLGVPDGKSTPIHLYQVDDRWWAASPLHLLRHAGYAPEEIDEYFDIKKSREARVSDIEAMLIEFGAQDFGSPTSTSTGPEGCTELDKSCMDSQAVIIAE
ncbi:hypothetical protein PFICI_11547 [Pestalotiopsis fici W106-1]|uniref:Uncharacterized protein n=1 Tax=Pestalotiopsis fici (strain W106-1 / CGMCC3.15140) TaxID=1229662 RepID=W3WQK2_PESFW|nr:uncharacterized protein PFICI_11547 [Pestalotiopsis fici W106-1]ETS76160.1 hypothetical protein PFICI_11547 [Pestalotiopsis fici W106-1]